MKVGLYFGTFNPIHIGHVKIANYMAEHTDLDEVWLVVSPHNPHKKKETLLDDFHRLEMVKIATDGSLTLKASDIEFDLPKPSYTATTLKLLQQQHPDDTFSLLMGEDNLRGFHTWFKSQEVLDNHKVYVYPRLITSQEQLSQELAIDSIGLSNHKNVILCKDVPIMNISSSFIREAIAEKKDVSSLLPEKVYDYLNNKNFYK